MLKRYVVVVCTAIELVACGGDRDSDLITLDEVGAARVGETCAELDEAMRNDLEAVDGVCRLQAANVGIDSLGPTVVAESAVSACEAAFPMCPRAKVRSVCIDACLDSNCDATLADLMACADRRARDLSSSRRRDLHGDGWPDARHASASDVAIVYRVRSGVCVLPPGQNPGPCRRRHRHDHRLRPAARDRLQFGCGALSSACTWGSRC